jgi:MYXO-CTERM domain-containing protein
MKTRRLVHSRAVAHTLLSTAGVLVSASLGIASAAAADELPCDGTTIDLAAGAELREDALASVFPDGVLGKGTVFTTDVRGEIFATSDAGWLWANAWGDVDLEAGGDVFACVDAASQRVTITWDGVPQKGGDPSIGNTFQIVLRPSEACAAGADVEVRIADLGWPILLEASSPDGLAPFGLHAEHAASSNVDEPGIYRFDSCPRPCPEGTVADGLSCLEHGPGQDGSERGNAHEVGPAWEALPPASQASPAARFPGKGTMARSAHVEAALTDADHEDAEDEAVDGIDDAGAGCSAGGGSPSSPGGLVALIGLAVGLARRVRRVRRG